MVSNSRTGVQLEERTKEERSSDEYDEVAAAGRTLTNVELDPVKAEHWTTI